MKVIALRRLGKYPKPAFSKIGKEMNRTRDGNTNQKILVDNALTCAVSLVSRYSHVSAKTEIKGIEARMAPARELRFDISAIATTSTVVITSLIT